MEYEYLQDEKGNENDRKAIAIYEKFWEARKAGLGYLGEKDGILYLAPAPEVLIDEQNRFHSTLRPAISWPNGLQCYFLDGIILEKDLWRSIVEKTLPAKEALAIQNVDQRAVALHYLGGDKILKELGGERFAKDKYGELWRLKDLKDGNGNPYVFFTDIDPSKGEPIYERVPPTMETPQASQEWAYRMTKFGLKYLPSVRT